VKLEATTEPQQVSLTAFDLSLGIQTSFSAQVEEPGQLTLPAKLLNEIVSKLPEVEITLESEPDTESLAIASAFGRYQVRGMSTEEFPELPVVENGLGANLPIAVLIEGLRGSLFAASADETKQVLTGVHLIAHGDNLEFAATDGHRLAIVTTATQEELEEASQPIPERQQAEFEVTVPARALRELERMVGGQQNLETVSLHLGEGNTLFELATGRLTSRTLEGQYPNYRQLIPKQFERQVTLERRALLSALERISVLADRKNNLVKFTLDGDRQQLYLSVEAADVGSARESMPAQISGEDLDIAFNVKYLMDGLKALSTAEIQMQLNGATTPVIFTPVGGLKMTYLVMPVQIRS
jgi:DNA polymerase-3 subunit beta